MKTPITTQIARAAFLGGALLLGACMTDGNENANVTGEVNAKTAGASLAASFAAAGDWNSNTATRPQQSLANFSTKVGTTLKKSTALPKSAGLGVEEKVILDDTGKGFFTYIKITAGIGQTTSDTAVGKWDEKSKDTVKDNENIISLKHEVRNHITGKVESIQFLDADGDGLINLVPGGNNKATLTFMTTLLGVTEKAQLTAGAGPDDNWDNENDNVIYSAVWTRSKAGVVIAEAEFEDGDADGIVADNAKTNVVKLSMWELEPKDKPFVRKAEGILVVRVFPKATGGDEPVSFSYTETMKTGRVNAVTMHSRDNKPEIIKNDTLWVKMETTVSAGDDTLKHAEIEFVINPGSDLKSDADDLLYAIHIKTQKKLGFERDAEFHFIAGTPVPHGQQPTSGSFSGHVTYADGKEASLEGTFSPDGFSAKFTGPDGVTVTVEFQKNGQVV